MEETETKHNESIDSNDGEQKAKDKLNQRREARRKKILDNAKDRLERLNGRTSTLNTSTSPSNNENQNVDKSEHFHAPGYNALFQNEEFSDPEIEPDILPQRPLPTEFNTHTNRENLFNNMTQNDMQRNDSETNNNPMDFLNLFGTPPTPVKKRHTFFRARLHLVLSALISCILTIFWKSNGFSIFIAPGICVITDLLFFREPKTMHATLLMIFMMLDQRILSVAQKYFHLFGIVQSIIADLGVFLFSYCAFLYIFAFGINDELFVIK